MEVSLFDFTRFVCQSGAAKMNLVSKIKNAPAYNPISDYWLELIKGVVDHHKYGFHFQNEMDRLLESVHPSKLVNYKNAISGYSKFIGMKSIEACRVNQMCWKNEDLIVNVKPELLISKDGHTRYIKLYFNKEKLSSKQIDVMLNIMKKTSPGDSSKSFGVLQVQTSRMYVSDCIKQDLTPLLLGESKCFRTIWERIDS